MIKKSIEHSLKRTRVLMILTEFPPAIGGMQTHAINLSRHLHKIGMEIIVYTYKNYEGFSNCKEIDASFPFPIKRVLSRISYYYSLKILTKAIKLFKPDLIYSSTIFYGILKKETGIPTICRSVGNDILRPWIIYPFKFGAKLANNFFLGKLLFRFFMRVNKSEFVELLLRRKRLELSVKAAKSSDKIIANSYFTKKLLAKVGIPRKKIIISVGGVDTKFFQKPSLINKTLIRENLGLPTDRKLLLTVCRLVDKKNVDFLIKSLALQSLDEKKTHLVVVGDGKRRKKLKSLAKSLGVSQFVTFVGAVPYEEIPPYFWACDIFLLASKVYHDPITKLCDVETMGRVLCEANAAGIPVIASKSGGIPSVIIDKKNGLLFPENNEKAFYQKLNLILSNESYYNRLVENGINIAKQKFDWPHILRSYEECLQLQ